MLIFAHHDTNTLPYEINLQCHTVLTETHLTTTYSKLVKRGYIHSLLFKYLKRFGLAYKIEEKCGEKISNLLFSRMTKNSPSVSCDMNNVTGINVIVKTCSVKITTIANKDIYINKPPLPTDVFEDVNTPIPCINTTDIGGIEGYDSYSLKYIAKCSTLSYENIPPSVLLGDENLNNTYVSRDASCQLVPLFILNKHIHPFGISNPKNHCYMNSVIQLLFSILRTIGHNFQLNSSPKGSLSKFLFEIAHSASSSTDVGALKFRLVQYDKFYGGQNQQDSSECLTMLIERINKGSVPYCGSNDNNDACGLRSPSLDSSSVLYITPAYTSSMQESIMQGMQQKLEKSCFRCKMNTWHVESNHIFIFYSLQNILLLFLIGFYKYMYIYINNYFTKDILCSISMDMTVVPGLHKFSQQATIDHHGPSVYSGHYTASINCCKIKIIQTTAKLRSLNWLIPKPPLLLMR